MERLEANRCEKSRLKFLLVSKYCEMRYASGRPVSLCRESARLAVGACITAVGAPSGRFATGFSKPVGERGFGGIGGPLVAQHLVETRIVVVQAEQQLAQLVPGLDTVTLGPGKDRE